MILIILFVSLLIWRAVYGTKTPYIDPVENDIERKWLLALIEQMEIDRTKEVVKQSRKAIQNQINEICKRGIEDLNIQFEAGKITEDEYNEGLNSLLDEMKID